MPENMKKISKLHYITTAAGLAEAACAGGADWIQLRLKNVPNEAYFAEAQKVKAVCRRYRATFIVNDNVEVAKAVGADGVHLGKEDMPPEEARVLLGEKAIIGYTANTRKDVIALSGKGVDYIGLGPFRFTATKQKLSPVLGFAGYSRMMEYFGETSVALPPVIAIGGIRLADVEHILDTGVHGIALSAAVSNAAEPATALREFKQITDTYQKIIKK
jgi:thiamine-phosphate pyrophosphorylase